MTQGYEGLGGLTRQEAEERLAKYGANEIVLEKKSSVWKKLFKVLREPVFLFLLGAALIYFLLGEAVDGAVMLVFVAFMAGIATVQEWKTGKTLDALKDLSAPRVEVVRDGHVEEILCRDLVVDDIMLVKEGEKIPADGRILRLHDLCVDESALSGESAPVWKQAAGDDGGGAQSHWRKDWCYAGTLVVTGSAAVLVERTAQATELGKIGWEVAQAPDRPTPLEKQTAKLIQRAAIVGVVLFVLVTGFTFLNYVGLPFFQRLTQSVLAGVALAMAMIPEEFPVILAVFLSMGAWRLARKQALVRRLASVETLGAISVLCVDKTGTLTRGSMEVQEVWHNTGIDEREFCLALGRACEKETYDRMEEALLAYCKEQDVDEETLFCGELVEEYSFTSETMMMGHVWQVDGRRQICVKGSPERVLELCGGDRQALLERQRDMARRGLRVIAVAFGECEEPPARISDCELRLAGFVGLADPPREAVPDSVHLCQQAGIRLVMMTGDAAETAHAIADQIGMDHSERVVTGAELEEMDEETLRRTVADMGIFARLAPRQKMRIVRALRKNGEIVAMTGDGVNDAPALKYADIGIAMGRRGTQVAREAADMVLLDDDFTTIVQTVADGRRIYDNICKAVGYVLAIHIPIALAALACPLLGLTGEALFFLPLHIVILELMIDPTCSIVFERQPAEPDSMRRPPRNPSRPLVGGRLARKAVFQGLSLFVASFGLYGLTHAHSGDADLARAMGLSTLVFANLFLANVNSSDTVDVFTTLKKGLQDRVMQGINLSVVGLWLVALYSPLAGFLNLTPLTGGQLLMGIGAAALSVFWWEGVKAVKRRQYRALGDR
ncbi:MAG: cation-translocating P-type ATPase [Christensenellales bacterium]|jgi:Ca2+-transporting ATPase